MTPAAVRDAMLAADKLGKKFLAKVQPA